MITVTIDVEYGTMTFNANVVEGNKKPRRIALSFKALTVMQLYTKRELRPSC